MKQVAWKTMGCHRVGVLLLTSALAACAGRGAVTPETRPQVASDSLGTEPLSDVSVTQALPAFESRQRAAALAAEQQGRWGEAAWAWESLHAIRPGDEAVAVRLQQAWAAAESRATLLSQQARLSVYLNDTAAARELFLRALATLPSHADAIDGLRALEEARVRNRIEVAGPVRSTSPRDAALRTQVAFAHQLVAQGELERAVNLLLPAATGRQPDPALRQQLSDIYLVWAERVHGQDPATALATLRKSLQMDPRNGRAAHRLREWQRRTPRAAERSPETRP